MAASTAAADGEKRASGISAALVTNGDVDHVAGLLTLRERQNLSLYGTAGVMGVIAANPIFEVLSTDCVKRIRVPLDEPFEPVPGLSVEMFAVPGKVPLYLEKGDVTVGEVGEMTVGLRLAAGGKSIFYIPGCAEVTNDVRNRVAGADAVLFDGTVFTDGEMEAAGVGTKTGRRMGHVPISGPGGSLEAFDGLGIGEKVYIHINNTNPILVEGSEERDRVEAHGWRVAHDGLELVP